MKYDWSNSIIISPRRRVLIRREIGIKWISWFYVEKLKLIAIMKWNTVQIIQDQKMKLNSHLSRKYFLFEMKHERVSTKNDLNKFEEQLKHFENFYI